MSNKQKKVNSIIFLLILLVFFLILTILIGKPMIEFVSEPEKFRHWVNGHGFFGKIVFLVMQVFQVLFSIIPGEPLEIGAGYAFGAFEGTILCMIGNLIGGVLIFLFVRTLGVRFVEIFFPLEKIQSLKFLQDERKFNTIMYIVFLLPGTPKDLLSYFAGLTKIKWSEWIFITTVGRLPSIVTSTISGGALGEKKYITAIVVFAITATLSILGFIIYNKIIVYHNNKHK